MYQVTLAIEGENDYTFYASDEDVELDFQRTLAEACELADIDTHKVVNAITEYTPDEDE